LLVVSKEPATTGVDFDVHPNLTGSVFRLLSGDVVEKMGESCGACRVTPTWLAASARVYAGSSRAPVEQRLSVEKMVLPKETGSTILKYMAAVIV
jgi:hypothetical protein